MKIFINNYSLICSLGSTKEEVSKKLFSEKLLNDPKMYELVDKQVTPTFDITCDLPAIPAELAKYNSRNNQFILKCLNDLSSEISGMIQKYGSSRIGVVFGTSTSGIDEGIKAMSSARDGKLPDKYDYSIQEIGSPSSFIKEKLNLESIAYTISTACSSGARAFIEGKNLIKNGICDVVIVGGSDSLNDLTLNGFHCLEAISLKRTNPFSKNRTGINIGEGCALFLLTSENLSQKPSLELLGAGESTDAYHISSPDPSGEGAASAMKMALAQAKLEPSNIDYINLHGTGTIKNDEMEAKAVSSLFKNTPVSSTKPLVGHTLGAAGAIEAAFCALSLEKEYSNGSLPIHFFDGEEDEELEKLNFVKNKSNVSPLICMSNSYAFGGNNASLIIGYNNG